MCCLKVLIKVNFYFFVPWNPSTWPCYLVTPSPRPLPHLLLYLPKYPQSVSLHHIIWVPTSTSAPQLAILESQIYALCPLPLPPDFLGKQTHLPPLSSLDSFALSWGGESQDLFWLLCWKLQTNWEDRTDVRGIQEKCKSVPVRPSDSSSCQLQDYEELVMWLI